MIKLFILLTFTIFHCDKIKTPLKGETLEVDLSGVKFTMIRVAVDSFLMGAQADNPLDLNYDIEANSEEGPVHKVTLTNDYYIGETEVTQALWMAVMGSNPSYFQDSRHPSAVTDNYPVERLSWSEIVGTSGSAAAYTVNGITYYENGFCYKLSELEGSGKQFRLPTEAEWEYAARSGEAIPDCPCKKTPNGGAPKYSGSNNIDKVAWYGGNSGSITHEVKTKQPNALGVYDMSGNVREYCSDWLSAYSSNAQINPIGPVGGSYHATRGGSFSYPASDCRITYRTSNFGPLDRSYELGFRLAL